MSLSGHDVLNDWSGGHPETGGRYFSAMTQSIFGENLLNISLPVLSLHYSAAECGKSV